MHGISTTLDAAGRRERARKAGKAAHSVDAHIAALVKRAPKLNDEQRAKLRALLNDAPRREASSS